MDYYINRGSILKKVQEQGHKAIVKKCLSIIQPRVTAAQNKMLSFFDSHPITLDLKTGQNTSGYLNYGDLYSFLGFDIQENPDPTEKIREILEEKIEVSFWKKGTNISVSGSQLPTYRFKIDVPKLLAIEEATENDLEWIDSFSWVSAIETGTIPNLELYISLSEKGRSWGGIQLKNPTSIQKTQRGTPWMTEVLKTFKKELKSFRS